MNIVRSYLKLFSVFLIFVFILPLVFIAQYTFPALDDLCRNVTSTENFFFEIKNWYMTHNGRYVNAFFSFLPVYDTTVYRIVVSLQFFILGYMLFRFVHSLSKMYKVSIKNSRIFFLSTLLFIFLISLLPSLYEFFYWYAAVTAYLFSFIFFLLFLIFNWKVYLGYNWNFTQFALVVVLLNGNNEIFLGLTNFLLLTLLFWSYFNEKKWNWRLLWLNLISWISSIILILSPGTLMRRFQISTGGSFVDSLKVAVLYGGKFIGEHFIELPFVLFFIIVFVWFYKSFGSNNRKYLNPLFLLVISYLSIISLYFIMFYATGLVDKDFGRVGNILHLVMATFVFLNIINLAAFLKGMKEISVLRYKGILPLLLSIFIVVLLFTNQNFADMRKDLYSGNLQRYKNEMQERILYLQQSNREAILVSEIEGTLILKSGDRYYVDQKWLQHCYKEYINSFYGKNYKRININIQK